MKKSFCLICIGVLLFSFGETQSQEIKNNTLIAKQIILNNIKLLENSLHFKDTLTLNNLLHPNLTLGHSNGWIEGKESLKNDLVNGFVVYDFFMPVGEIEFHFLSDNLIITRRNVDVHGTYSGYEFVSCLNIMEVWTLLDEQWLLTARQSVDRK